MLADVSRNGVDLAMATQSPANREGDVAGRVAEAARVARDMYELGARCSRTLGQGLCCDPGLNILLDLFVSTVEGRRLSVTSVCIGSRAATATALRYVALLGKAGYVERLADEKDGRRSYVILTQQGWARMLDMLRPTTIRAASPIHSALA